MNSPSHSHTSVGLILRAASFAADKHRSQRRKGGDLPYINHPLATADLLWHVGKVHDPVTIVAAILHDTLEDTQTTPEELERHFGSEVRDIVVELTEDMSLPSATRRERELANAASLSARARLVRFADKAHNLFSLVDHPPVAWDQDKQQKYADWCGSMALALDGTNAQLEAHFRDVLAQALRAIAQRRSSGTLPTSAYDTRPPPAVRPTGL